MKAKISDESKVYPDFELAEDSGSSDSEAEDEQKDPLDWAWKEFAIMSQQDAIKLALEEKKEDCVHNFITTLDWGRQVSAADLSREIVEDNIKVTMDDFMSALNEVKPAFGAAINTLEMCRLNGMLDCGERHAHIQRTIMTFVEQVSFKVREHLCSLASLKDLVAGSAFSALSRAAQCSQCISMDISENTGEFENPASTHTPQNYTCSTLTSGGSRKAQAVSNKYRSG
ncbi:hypothetical protein BDL97_18G105300 [Sphagnum fallax]|nr:hypothetical protein BDL97_18G105300 [Sphagnum fallax]